MNRLCTRPAKLTVIHAVTVLLSVGFAAAAQPVSAADDYDHYIGMTYTGGSIDALPGNLVDSGGWIVRNPSANTETDYAIADITDEETNTRLVFFNEEIGRSVTAEGDHAVWEIVDVMSLPQSDDLARVDNPDASVFLRPWCSYDESPDPELFALADTANYETAEFFPAIAAWRANIETETLEPVTTKGLLCVNIGP